MGGGIDFTVRKARPDNPSDLFHYLSAFATDLLLTQALAYVAAGNGVGQIQYLGLAQPGSSQASPVWLIKLFTYNASNQLTDIQFATGKATFENIWTNRAALSYS